ncbi:putative TFIIH subunit Tfb4/GTF2H3, von Willebrand factor A-like domain superfamily [Helianthus annuus]|nr:putative TFIIH subunit Tfb4/GTF2H3, von Willebrand factor A-like domain superfamily [Helianthus annuus]
MTPVSSKQYADDVSLLMVLIDTNPLFWSSTAAPLSFSKFLSQVLSFVNSVLLLNQLNQVMVIATGLNSCDYIYDSSSGPTTPMFETLLQKLEDFVAKDEELNKDDSVDGIGSSLLSGSLSMALCYFVYAWITRWIWTVCLFPVFYYIYIYIGSSSIKNHFEL